MKSSRFQLLDQVPPFAVVHALHIDGEPRGKPFATGMIVGILFSMSTCLIGRQLAGRSLK